MSEENKAVVRRGVEIWNTGNVELADENLVDEYVYHNAPPGIPPNREGWKQFFTMYHTAFPDTHLTIEDEIAEGNKVVVRFTVSGTHKGVLMGIAPTDKRSTVTAIGIYRVEGGKIMEDWMEWDALGMMQQLGVIPAPGEGGG